MNLKNLRTLNMFLLGIKHLLENIIYLIICLWEMIMIKLQVIDLIIYLIICLKEMKKELNIQEVHVRAPNCYK